MYKPTSKPELQSKTEPEKTLSVLKIQDSIYNPYVFRAAMSFSYISGASLFIGINITDFLERFEDIATDYGFSDDRKIQRV